MLRAASLAVCATIFFAYGTGTQGQNPPSATPQSKVSPEANARSDAEAENELEKAIANAGNDRAALVRNLKNYLQRFPDSPRRAAVYRALVESCEQLRDS